MEWEKRDYIKSVDLMIYVYEKVYEKDVKKTYQLHVLWLL